MLMTRVKTTTFFELHDLDCTDETMDKYNNGWTLSEIKAWVEFVAQGYNAEVKAFRQTTEKFNLQK